MRIHLTGRITIEDDERVLEERDLPGRQGRTVFARLAWEHEPVHREVLADLLWPEELPSTWERTLVSIVSRLRSALSGIDGLTITNAFGCYQLEHGGEVDVEIAAAECDAAERALAVGDAATAGASASVAAAIARRPLLAGDEGPWVEARRSDLRAVLVRALEVGAEAALGTSEAVSAAGEAVEADPFRERANLLLMRAHQAVGNVPEALRAYERYRELLADELGADPGPEVQAVHIELLRSDDGGRVEALERSGLLGLPRTRTTFVGRADALSEVGALLATERLVTLTGAGGVGKTRLAIELARRSLDLFPDGVWLVDLAPLDGDAPIVEHVSLALGLKCATVESLARILDEQRVLLIVDNCEQVLEPVARMTERLLAEAPGPVVLATSRSPLGLAAEHVWRVPSLQLPSEDQPVGAVESVALFCDRAAAVRPDFELTTANAASVAAICTRLDGVPLAIELAAARVSGMSAAEIAERLDDRFALLRGATAGLPRHRTLRAAIDWSYDLLGAREAEVFRATSVFEGSFAAEHATGVCGRDVSDELALLCERSLLTSDDERYRMLETIKEYARERASASDAWDTAVDRHLETFVALAPSLESSRDQAGFLAGVRALGADVTAALQRALDRDRAADAVALARVMASFWLYQGLWTDGVAYLDRTLDAAAAAGLEDGTGHLVVALATMVDNAGESTRAVELWDRGLAIATRRGDDPDRAAILVELAGNAYATGRGEEGRALAQQALEVAEASGNDFAAGRALMVLASDLGGQDGVEAVRGWYERARDRFTAAGHQSGIARAQMLIGMTFDTSGPDRAAWEEPMLSALEASRRVGDHLTESIVLFQLGLAMAEADLLTEALDVLQRDLRLCRRIGNRWTALNCVEQIGLIEAARGRPSVALRLLAAAPTLRGEAVLALSFFGAGRSEALRERAMAEDPNGEASWDAGSKLSYEEACDLALSATH